ncbi:PIG-L family deacetylase [Leucobacter denitrificans]|uniref:PIG-L family deacetylase n=1 Tax=Leucobacter denitrificans TaxID=683042 RepID=A0A7G9S2X3_9MICO|nr:PIG-L family deacetylase [Leucobacter denitrificans]QNN62198.1 PIG-L family deacetylase [Leucobacter denitrificans]
MSDAEVKPAVHEWFGGAVRVLFVHAHPDDETITTGGTLAALAEAGLEPLLVTLTRGEQGEVVPGPLEAMAAAHGLAVVRQNELKNALAMLGLERHVFLGVPPARAADLEPTIYEDSGMSWLPDGRAGASENASADSLTTVPAVESLTDLLAVANDSGAGAIVSYDDGGGYGHPDHVHAHCIARAVAMALQLPFWEIVSGDVADIGADTNADTVADTAVEAHDISPWYERKQAALRTHTTQLSVDGDDIVHVGGQRHPIGRVERFRRVDDPLR